jgi:predicted amidohydrolase YtcJ
MTSPTSPTSMTSPTRPTRPAAPSAGRVVVFRNGPVFTGTASRATASAVAVVGEHIAAVGGDEQVAPFVSRADEIVDLDGRLLGPGFHDAHAHPLHAGLELIRCDLTPGETAVDYLDLIGRYASANPDQPWILGGGWAMAAFPGGCPTAVALDAVVADRPVLLPNRDHHSAWVNSRALELAGIDARTPDPADGRIERDAAGNPTGTLHEGAEHLVRQLAPQDTTVDFDDALRLAQDHLHALGIVGWQDAWVLAGDHDAYLRADTAGRLTARVRGALWWERGCPADGVAEQVAELVRAREQAAGSVDLKARRYVPGTVKVMQDGVAETYTAAMLEPYLDRCGHPTANTGHSFLDAALLRQVVPALDAAGFQVHFHALGDRAVRECLDAVEAAGITGKDLRHHLAHLQLVHPDDIGRFRPLRAAATIQALWACHDPQMDELTIPFLGDRRAGWQYPFGDLERAGAVLAMGSDWPVSSPDPWQAIHVAVNRVEPGAAPDTPPLLVHQQLSLATALTAYTAGSAWVNHVDDVSGSITVGRQADLAVCDRDPFNGGVEEIAHTRVQATYVAGRLVSGGA